MKVKAHTSPPEKFPATEKLQKILARAGLGSRRSIEKWIQDGRVQVNRQVAKLGDRASSQDKIFLDGKLLRIAPIQTQLLLYHKPEGEVCSHADPEGRPTVFDRLPKLSSGKWISIGRLDINSAGLLLLTNDGELANRLMHPSQQIEREYAVRVLGDVKPEMINRLKKGVTLEDGVARFKRIKKTRGQGANTWYHVVLTEGRHREVRRLWVSQGVTVSRLLRIRFGQWTLPRDLKAGQWIDVDPHE